MCMQSFSILQHTKKGHPRGIPLQDGARIVPHNYFFYFFDFTPSLYPIHAESKNILPQHSVSDAPQWLSASCDAFLTSFL